MPLGAYHTREARCRHNSMSDGAGDGLLSVARIVQAHHRVHAMGMLKCLHTLLALQHYHDTKGDSKSHGTSLYTILQDSERQR